MNAITAYEMNPATDTLMYGDDLQEDMWVLQEDAHMRCSRTDSEDYQLRMNRFCRVTRPREGHGPCAVFIGEWVDGYQKSFSVHHSFAWIVKRDQPDDPGAFPASTEEGAPKDRFMSCPCGRGDYGLCQDCPYDFCSVHGSSEEK